MALDDILPNKTAASIKVYIFIRAWLEDVPLGQIDIKTSAHAFTMCPSTGRTPVSSV